MNALTPVVAPLLGATTSLRRGVVGVFDGDVGLGVVRDTTGSSHPFHCTAIADGSRQIDAGAAVVFFLSPGHLGRFEASGIEAVSSATSADAASTE